MAQTVKLNPENLKALRDKYVPDGEMWGECTTISEYRVGLWKCKARSNPSGIF